MKLHKWLILILILVGFFFFYQRTTDNGVDSEDLIITRINMKITSTAFEHNADIPTVYTCEGDNISPALSFIEVPEGTQTLALINHDPDAPVKGGWTHWVIFNMAPDTTGIAENTNPGSGIQGTTSFGSPGYGGPCPPSGKHRYFFNLYALDIDLDLDSSATKTDVEAAIADHILEEAELIGLYEKVNP